MKRNFERNIHILNQIMGYCKNAGAVEIAAKISFHDEHVTIVVTSCIESLDDKLLNELRRHIAMPRQPEIEQDYWNIGLSGNLGDEIILVGMMTDQSEVCYEKGILTIAVERQN